VPERKETQSCPAERSSAWQDEVERNDGALNASLVVLQRNKSMPALIAHHG